MLINLIDQLHEILDEDVCAAFKEFGVTAELMEYRVEQEGFETVTFSKVGSTISISFFLGVARVTTIRVTAFGNGKRLDETAHTIEDQLELMENIQEWLE